MEKSRKETGDPSLEQPKQNNQPPDHSLFRLVLQLTGWGSIVLLLFCIGVAGWVWSYARTPAPGETETIVFIPQGAGVRQINTLLAEHGVVKDDFRFLLLARLTGTGGRLRAGEYLIPPGRSPLQILSLLEKGEVIQHPVTLPEGLSIYQVSQILSDGKWIDPDRFLALTEDREFIRSLGLDVDNLEGYLFPDTYLLARGNVSEKKLITMMVNRFFSVWESMEAANQKAMSRHQVITLASIVEKETAAPEERPLIAAVFHNRLSRKMRLQSDPTVIYGLKEFDGNLTRGNLRSETPYNTYVIAGLPPGPICNPGKESIQAVLEPADTPYLYFVSRNDGTHHFSESLKEHNRAVRKYQKNGRL